MEPIQVCTQMTLEPDQQVLADMLSVQENPLNGAQITAGDPINSGSDGAVDLALPVGSMWKPGRTLRVKILNGTPKIKEKIKQYAEVWTKYGNIKFSWVDSGDAEIRVNVDSSGQSASYVGTNNLAIPADRHTMNFGWLTDSTAETEFSRVITHEFGHALGCIHEHQSPGANIPWNKEAVYKHYEASGWSRSKVDHNIFELYSATTTQFSTFDTKSIMIYAIPAAFTTNGFSVGWNRQLSETDKTFIAAAYPAEGLDVAYFNTLEIRPADQPAKEAFKRQIFHSKYQTPPQMALGLNWLDVSKDANIRVTAFADKITTESANVHINTWADTTLFSAGCTWFTASAQKDPDYQVGQFSTLEDHPWHQPKAKTSRRVNFARPYAAPPKIVVWLNGLDMGMNKNWRVVATASDIDAKGFTIHIDTWADTTLYSAAAGWIAYPANKAGVVSGTYSIQDIRPWDEPRPNNAGRVNFPAGALTRQPTVLIAFSSMDIGAAHNLRVRLSADSVSKDGLNWHIDSWSDTTLFSASASYIAFT